MTRKEIVTNTYRYGGLIGAIALGIFTFICTRHEVWHYRLFSVIVMTVIFPGTIGVVLGGIAFILTLPFYRSISWDIEEPFGEGSTSCRYCSTTLYKRSYPHDSIKEFCDDDCEGAWMRGDRVFSSDDVKEIPIPISDRFEIMDL